MFEIVEAYYLEGNTTVERMWHLTGKYIDVTDASIGIAVVKWCKSQSGEIEVYKKLQSGHSDDFKYSNT